MLNALFKHFNEVVKTSFLKGWKNDPLAPNTKSLPPAVSPKPQTGTSNKKLEDFQFSIIVAASLISLFSAVISVCSPSNK